MQTKQYSTRTFLELSVGGTHTIEVLLNLRRADIEWWNSDSSSHQRQLFRLLGRRVLPVECSGEIERYHNSKRRRRDNQKSSIVIGEKNIKAAAVAVAGKGGNKTGGGGRAKADGKRTSNSRAARRKDVDNADTKAGAQKTIAPNKEPSEGGSIADVDGSNTAANTGQDISYLFGDTIQATYKVEDIDTTESATLLYEDDDEEDESNSSSCRIQDLDGNDNNSKHTRTSTKRSGKRKAAADGTSSSSSRQNLESKTKIATFRQLVKIPKRIIIWCYPFDPSNPTQPITEGGGFPRPEMIPITSLFHGED